MNPVATAVLHVLPALGLMLLNGVVLIWMLRKVLGHLHVRLGPTVMGPAGIFQTALDVVKLVTKEDPTPRGVDKVLYFLAPAVVFVPSLMAYAPLPFSQGFVMANSELGLLLVFAVLSIIPLGVLMAGWASANKWSLYGGMRAVGQQVAYEVPLLIAALPVALMVGSLNLADIVAAQSRVWFFWIQIPAFVLFFVAALVELNQTPFDMSEADSELVAGFATEYSAMKFGLLFLAEFSNLFVMSALMVTLFFGGWRVPFVPDGTLAGMPGALVFIFKTYVMIFVLMWIRGTLPRVRVDQLQQVGWKGLLPASLVWLMVTAIVLKAVPAIAQVVSVR
jgi:NADH-quinone oxidoreductase subunit H